MALAGDFDTEIPINGNEQPLIDQVDVRGALGPKHIIVENDNLADACIIRVYAGDADPDGIIMWAQISLDADPENLILGSGVPQYVPIELSDTVEMMRVTALIPTPPGAVPSHLVGKLIKPPGKFTTDRGG